MQSYFSGVSMSPIRPMLTQTPLRTIKGGTAHESVSNDLRDVPANTFMCSSTLLKWGFLCFDHPACVYKATSNTFNLIKNQLLYFTGSRSTPQSEPTRMPQRQARPSCARQKYLIRRPPTPHSSLSLLSLSTTNNAFHHTCVPITTISRYPSDVLCRMIPVLITSHIFVAPYGVSGVTW